MCERKGEEAVDYQAGDHSKSIHGKLANYMSNIFQLQNLPSNQGEDSHWGIPVEERGDTAKVLE